MAQVLDDLSISKGRTPHSWKGYLQDQPRKWNTADGEIIVNALLEEQRNPIVRPIAQNRLHKQLPVLSAKMGSVTIPESDAPESTADHTSEEIKEHALHTEVQWLLLKVGNDMGLDVWVASNDRSKTMNGNQLRDLPRIKKELPLQFDAATN
jgi:hypothetical protein